MRTLQIRTSDHPGPRALRNRQNREDRPLSFHYVDDATFRRRILTQLNHTELRHRLGRRIHHGRTRRNQKSASTRGRKSSLAPLASLSMPSCIWNAIYMQEAIRPVRSDGMDVSKRRHRSPLPADLAPSQLPRAVRLLAARHRYERWSQAAQEPYFRMGLLSSLTPLFLFRSAAQALSACFGGSHAGGNALADQR